jgi:hypothetical protein
MSLPFLPRCMEPHTARLQLLNLSVGSRAHIVFRTLSAREDQGVAAEVYGCDGLLRLHSNGGLAMNISAHNLPLDDWEGIVRIVPGVPGLNYDEIPMDVALRCDYYDSSGIRFRRFLTFSAPPMHLTFVSSPRLHATPPTVDDVMDTPLGDLWAAAAGDVRPSFGRSFATLATLAEPPPTTVIQLWLSKNVSRGPFFGESLLRFVLHQFSLAATAHKFLSLAFKRLDDRFANQLCAVRNAAVPAIAKLEFSLVSRGPPSSSVPLAFRDELLLPLMDGVNEEMWKIRRQLLLSPFAGNLTTHAAFLWTRVVSMLGELREACRCSMLSTLDPLEQAALSVVSLTKEVMVQWLGWEDASAEHLLQVVEAEAALSSAYHVHVAPETVIACVVRFFSNLRGATFVERLKSQCEAILNDGGGTPFLRLCHFLALFPREARSETGLEAIERLVASFCKKHALEAVSAIADDTPCEDAVGKLSEILTRVQLMVADLHLWTTNQPCFPWLVPDCPRYWQRCSFPKAADVFGRVALAAKEGLTSGLAGRSARIATLAADWLNQVARMRNSDGQLEEDVGRVIFVLSLSRSADVFETLYQQHLTHRLVRIEEQDLVTEKRLLTALGIPGIVSSTVRSHCSALISQREMSWALSADFEAIRDEQEPAFSSIVFSHCLFPARCPAVLLSLLPRPMRACLDHFASFYRVRFPQRQLRWHVDSGTTVISFSPRSVQKVYEVHCSLLGGCMLMRVAASGADGIARHAISLQEDGDRTVAALLEAEIAALLSAKVCCTSDVSDTCCAVRLNHNFSEKPRKIFVRPRRKSCVPLQIDAQRSIAVECAVIKILKARGKCSFDEIVASASTIVKSFTPTVRNVKLALEDLCRREYVERVADFPSLFQFLA